MISFIEGEVIQQHEGEALVLNRGLGFNIITPQDQLAVGVCYRLFLVWAGEMQTDACYGFLSWTARTLFVHLLTITNIGVKTAAQILARTTAANIIQKINQFDFAFFAGLEILQLTPSRLLAMVFKLQRWYGQRQGRSQLNVSVINSLLKMGYNLPLIYRTLTHLYQQTRHKPTATTLIQLLNQDIQHEE